MKIVSVNVSVPQTVEYQGEFVTTSIFKQPVNRRVAVHTEHLEGDQQADLSVHGGPDKAVYVYPYEHYAYWEKVLGRSDFQYGQFGENLTIHGLIEDNVWIGDVFRVGTAVLQVSQPRIPCFKLGIKMGDPSFVKRFLQARRSGFYCRVLEVGDVAAGDRIERLERGPNPKMSITFLYRLRFDEAEPDLLQQAVELIPLSTSWRDKFAQKLNE
ncbi:MAG: MOSC domain-containing protein [Phototrophicales bacterium]|nr:MAG: MOSC domain-containing protein [Phototrophicales bacterium]